MHMALGMHDAVECVIGTPGVVDDDATEAWEHAHFAEGFDATLLVHA